MKLSSRIVTLVGLLSLGAWTPTVLGQVGYDPLSRAPWATAPAQNAYGGYNPHVSPYRGGYSTARLRQAAAGGAPPTVLANEFGGVAANYQRMESRMYRISRGQVGPNIARALEMGRTIEQLRSILP